MSDPQYHAFRLRMVEMDGDTPDGKLSLHYLAFTRTLEEALEFIKKQRGDGCEIIRVEDPNVEDFARSLGLAPGEVREV